MNPATYFVAMWMLILSIQGLAQTKKNRIQPGRIYNAGETLFAPRFGFIAKVPDGWEGTLPRESEVFLLSTTTSTYGEIFVFGRELGEINAMQNDWKKGVALTETMKLKAVNPTVEDGLLTSEVTASGEYVNRGFKGFAAARCSYSGPCITTLMVAPPQFYESVKNTVTEFMKAAKLEPPSNASPYAEFDWQEFLSNKVLMTYQSMKGGSKENKIHLCKDGSFSAEIKHKGIFKDQNPAYKGTQTGNWAVKGVGEKTIITFIFNKGLPPLEAPLLIKDEQVFSNNDRYFVGQSDRCK